MVALPHDFAGEDRQAVDAVRQAILAGIPRQDLPAFEFPFYSARVGREARRMSKMIVGLSDVEWDRLMGAVRPALHPLGHAARVDEDPRTKANRDAVAGVLRLYFENALVRSINSHEDAAIGLALTDRMVSQLELGEALAWLNFERLDLSILLLFKYRDGWTDGQIAQRLHMGRGGVSDKINAGLDYLIQRIWT